MHYPLVDGFDAHRMSIPRERLAGVLPHSTHLGADRLKAMRYDTQRGLFLHTDPEKGTIELPPPLVVSLDGILSTRDGDHRLFTAYAADAASVPIACYDLANEDDLRAVSDWHEEIHFVAPLVEQGCSRAMIASMARFSVTKPYVDIVRGARAFVRSEGIGSFADLVGRRFATKEYAGENYEIAFAQWERDRR